MSFPTTPTLNQTYNGYKWNGELWEVYNEPEAGATLQYINITDNSNISSSSSTDVDTGLQISITPKRSDSLLIINFYVYVRIYDTGANRVSLFMNITDISNISLIGDNGVEVGTYSGGASGQDTRIPTTIKASTISGDTSEKTYKLRWRKELGTGMGIYGEDSETIITVQEIKQ